MITIQSDDASVSVRAKVVQSASVAPVTITDSAADVLYTVAGGNTQAISDSTAKRSDLTAITTILAEGSATIPDSIITNSDASASTTVMADSTKVLPNKNLINSAGTIVGTVKQLVDVTVPDETFTQTDGSPVIHVYDTPFACDPGPTFTEQMADETPADILTALTTTGKKCSVQELSFAQYTSPIISRFLGRFFGTSITQINGIDTDGAGNIYMAINGTTIQKYDEATKTLQTSYTGFTAIMNFNISGDNTHMVIVCTNSVVIRLLNNTAVATIAVTGVNDAALADDNLSIYTVAGGANATQYDFAGNVLSVSTSITGRMRSIFNHYGSGEISVAGDNGNVNTGRVYSVDKTTLTGTLKTVTGNTLTLGAIDSMRLIGSELYLSNRTSSLSTLITVNSTTMATISQTPLGMNNVASRLGRASSVFCNCVYAHIDTLSTNRALHILS